MGSEELIEHLFLHWPSTLGLWYKLCSLSKIDWVPPKSIGEMIIIAFRGLESSIKGKTLWQIACLTMLWIGWQERNVKILEEKWRTKEMLWNLLHFNSSLWACCTIIFRGVALNVIQINWFSVCNSKGLANNERNRVQFWGNLCILKRSMPLCIVLV